MAHGRRKKKRTHVKPEDDPSKKGPPKSFVFWRGRFGLVLKSLETDLRRLMSPHTAAKLKESQRNQMKDFVSIAGPLGVSHFLVLTATDTSCYLRLAKGPTLTMRIAAYTLMRDVTASQQRPRLPSSLWKTPPLLVMSNFSAEGHMKLAATLFQNMFPAINVQDARLSACQRVVLLSHDPDAGLVRLRHYSIRAQPSGVTKAVKQLVSRRLVPDLGGFEDAADFLAKSGMGSESEGEEAASTRVELAQDMGRGNLASRQSRIVLQEIGPRLDLEIIKAEEGVCGGKVLYHRYITRTPEEVAAQSAAKKSEEELRDKRRRQQEENVKRKMGMKKRKSEAAGNDPSSEQKPKKRKKEWWEVEEKRGRGATDADDDAEYYRQEVGEEPTDMPRRSLKGPKKPSRRSAAPGGRAEAAAGRGQKGRKGARSPKPPADGARRKRDAKRAPEPEMTSHRKRTKRPKQ